MGRRVNKIEKRALILNTSSQGKLQEFKRLFSKYGVILESRRIDLDEIEADPLTVVVHKASQLGEEILVEDTSLDIEGAQVGIQVRWLLEDLSKHIGRKAQWRALLAYQKGGLIHVFEGKVNGAIVQPRGKHGFGFDPYFLPEGSASTLAEAKPDKVNARAKAVEALLQNQPLALLPLITHWVGPYQEFRKRNGD